ncbi:hypothetical protein JB92DRAFT_2928143 [Gautieria morchelliformis]|nr:hypothetical protein JB92DRAFT_2928143 [Gautieria morchelliformis]
MKGARSLLDPRKQQHEEISQMYVYTQTLEKALAELQKLVSPNPHPLLAVASSSYPPNSSHTSSHDSEIIDEPIHGPDEDEDLLAEAFGVLSIRNRGNVEFHGPTAISEVHNYI